MAARVSATYAARAANLQMLLRELSEAVQDHADWGAESGEPNWALCGDLDEAQKRLVGTLAFLSHRNEQDLRNELSC